MTARRSQRDRAPRTVSGLVIIVIARIVSLSLEVQE
jgi:hypothetical protein